MRLAPGTNATFRAALYWIAAAIRVACAIWIMGWLIGLIVWAEKHGIPDEWMLLVKGRDWGALIDMVLTISAAILLIVGIPSLLGFALAQLIEAAATGERRKIRTKVPHTPSGGQPRL